MARRGRQSTPIGIAVGAAIILSAPLAARAADVGAAAAPVLQASTLQPPAVQAAAAPANPAVDQDSDTRAEIAALKAREDRAEQQIQAQAALIQQQAQELAATKVALERERQDLASMRLATADLQSVRAAGAPSDQIMEIASNDSTASSGGQPVGEAPPVHPNAALALPLPPGINVLTPRGHLVFDNSFEYQNSSSDRLVFSGIQIVNAIQIGLLQANTTSNDSGIYSTTFRYGLFDRLEVELVVPWVARQDRVTTVQTVTPATDLTRIFNIRGSGLGDVEGTVRYQLTRGEPGYPILVASLRVVSNSGTGPFDVPYNDTGVAEKLSTGSGFWVVNPQVSMIYPLDPIVIFGSLGYQHSFGENIDKFFGSGSDRIHVGRAQPGDAISGSVGFAFSLNQRFSYSLGYKEVYFLPSTTIFLPSANNVVPVKGKTLELNDGSLLLGASYRVNNHVSLNLNFEFGVTADAPSDTILFRVPYLF